MQKDKENQCDDTDARGELNLTLDPPTLVAISTALEDARQAAMALTPLPRAGQLIQVMLVQALMAQYKDGKIPTARVRSLMRAARVIGWDPGERGGSTIDSDETYVGVHA